jgi:hypothetical protein
VKAPDEDDLVDASEAGQTMQAIKTIPKTTPQNLMLLRIQRMRTTRILAQMSSWKRLKRPRM